MPDTTRTSPRFHRSFGAFLLLLLGAPLTFALEPVYQKGGAAIKGYDPVAYITLGQAVEGSPGITSTWQGATWRFANSKNRELFNAEPEKYAPQYGGYCAYAVSIGKTAGINPEAFDVVDGKLYLNYSKKIQSRWQKEKAANIEAADKNWPELLKD